MDDKLQDRLPQDDAAAGGLIAGTLGVVEEPVEPAQIRKTLSLAMRIGDALLSAGMSAGD